MKAFEGRSIDFQVDWKAFMLRPDFPKEGVLKEEVMAQKFGSKEKYREVIQSMKQNFAEVGVTFNPEGQRTGSSLASHRIMVFAKNQGKQDEMADELFRRYTCEQQWIGDVQVCVEAAGSVGLDSAKAAEFLKDPKSGMEEVEKDLAWGKQLQVSGVPFFVVNNKYAVSGAQDASAFVELFEKLELEVGAHSAARQ